MNHSVLVNVIGKRNETDEAFSFFLEIPNANKNDFKFKSGQYLSISIYIGMCNYKRAYSICTSPDENNFGFTVKRLDKGIVSNYLIDVVQIGDSIQIYPPEGNFTIPESLNLENPVLFIAAGSGITPIFSMIKDIARRQSKKRIYLVYGNRNESTVIYKKQIDILTDSQFECKYVFSNPNNSSIIGSRITGDILRNFFREKRLDKYRTDVFVCGPEGLLDCVKTFFLDNRINEKHLHYELFWQKQNLNIPSNNIYLESIVSVKLDGDTYEIPMNSSDRLLDKLLYKNIDAPYTCQNGTCSTCKAKVLQGQMGMFTCHSLNTDEIANGFVLTCQAYPESELVTVDFDY